MSQFLTEEELLKEIYKCGKSPAHFIKTYCKISHPQRGLIPFKIWDFQEKILEDYIDHEMNIILKSRQLGVSTLTAAYCAWLMLFHRSKNIIVVATQFTVAQNLVVKVKEMIKNLEHTSPFLLELANIEIDNRTSFKLSNGSQIKAFATNQTVGRSEAASLVVLDEAAHIEGLSDLWTALEPTMAAGGRCIALSCVTKDTYVFTKKGIQQVGDFIEQKENGGYSITPYDILGKDKLRKGQLFLNNGIAETRKIITRFAELEGSLEHKVWAFSKNKFGWVKMGDINKGDWVSIQKGNNIWGDNDTVMFKPEISSNHQNIFSCDKITPDIAYVLGMFLAEGSSCIYKNGVGEEVGYKISFTCGDNIKESLEKIGFHVYHDGNLRYSISSKTFGDFLKYLGFDLSLKAPKKIIPKRLLQMSKENTISLLKGIFSGDGWSRKDIETVGIELSSPEMIKQIRMLLLNLGIITTYKQYITPPTQKVKVSSVQHRITMDQHNSKLFYDIVGFDFERKQINENVLGNRQNNSYDVVPNGKRLAAELFSYYKKGMWNLNKYHGIQLNGLMAGHQENISRKTLLKLYEIVKKDIPDAYKAEIEKVLCENLVWVPISEIECGEKEVYDFSLPDNEQDFWAHSVIYNGILGHQSPNGNGNWFYEQFIAAEKGETEFNPIKLMWWVHPERGPFREDERGDITSDWWEKVKKKTSRRQRAQEYNCEFNASGETVIDPEDILFMEENTVDEPAYRIGFDRNLWVWEKYDFKKNYMIVADVARGDGEDYSTFHVLEIDSMEQVAEYHGQISVDMFARLITDAGRDYGDALVIPENNSLGHEVCNKLVEFEYPNIYYHEKGDHTYVEHYKAQYATNVVAGFTISSKTRPLVVAKLEEFIRNNLIIIKSKRTVEELRTFIWKNGRPEAQKGKNDDLIMPLAIGCWVRDTVYDKHQKKSNFKRISLNTIKKNSTVLDTTIPGQVTYNPNSSLFKTAQKQKEERKKFSWLFMG